MTSLRAAFLTLGCRTNHYETDAIRSQFLQAGFSEVPFDAVADVYIVNTCTVTGEADRKSRQMLRRARRLNADAVVAALGCQVEVSRSRDLADVAIGTYGKKEILARVLAELDRRGSLTRDGVPARQDASGGTAGAYEEFGLVGRPSETRAYIKIEDGCDSFCSYCAIPLARGRVRSRSQAMILQEARALADQGLREIVLTGIHVCSYGAEQGRPSHAVMELALELAEIPGLKRIRLGSLEPQSITTAFVRLARANAKLLPHFHLSLQSGSDSVLRRMGRQYDCADFRAVAALLRHAYDGDGTGMPATPGLTTDIMVGFPGETDAEHDASLAFCREIGFSRLHVFRYSSRPGTAAATMPDPVDAAVISRRGQAMQELAGRLALEFHGRQVGRCHSVLLEELRPDGFFAGYTPEYVPVRIPAGPGLAAGQIAEVTAVAARRDFLVCHNANTGESCYD